MKKILGTAMLGRIALSMGLVLSGVMFVATGSAHALVIGAGATGGNCFPFGCKINDYSSTRYQQVYNSNQFSGLTGINGLTFFLTNNPGGNFVSGTFNFELSITSKGINGLSTTNFNSNVTGPILSTGSLVLSGGAASTFMVNLTPFLYDPSLGNLLMDIKIPGGTSGGLSFFDAYNHGLGNGITSRVHNFGTGFDGWGLKTEFKEVTVATSMPEPSSVILLGSGLVGLIGYRVRKVKA